MRLYDLHYHAFDLSHVNLLAFLSRPDLVTPESLDGLLEKIPWYARVLPIGLAQIPYAEKKIAGMARNYIAHDATRIRSLLSILENAIESHFLFNDYFLRNKSPFIANPDKPDPAHALNPDKIILCPLLMDFGEKKIGDQSQFYNNPPGKPIVNQVVDIINAIYFYFHYDLVPDPAAEGRFITKEIEFNPSGKLFEIYPFLGVNPVNYTYGQIERLFEKYFTGFEHDTPTSRKTNLFERMGKRHLDITTISGKKGADAPAGKPDCNYMFAGIKLYPPLGFNPWPDDEKELQKVRLIYDRCLEKNIPITTHCSDGGYLTDPRGKDFSNPGLYWKKVLTHPDYQHLKIDFAHFGHQQSGETDWKQTILAYFGTNPNVYSDISCCGFSAEFYQSFKTYLNPSDMNRFLFGSDFLINLLWIDSYNQYLDLFLSDQNLDATAKLQLCNVNAERFLFG